MNSLRDTWIRIGIYTALLSVFIMMLGLSLRFVLLFSGHYNVQTKTIVTYFSQVIGSTVAAWFFLRSSRINVFDFLGLVRRGRIKETVVGVILTSTIWFIAFTAKSVLGGYKVTDLNDNFSWLYPSVIVLCIAISEEIINRGFIFQTLEGHYGTKRAMIISSVLFGLSHIFNFDSTPSLLVGVISIAFISCGGLLLTAGFLVHRRLWLPIGLHFGWDMTLQTFRGGVVNGAPSIFTGVYEPNHFSLTALTLILGLTYLLVHQAKKNGNWRAKPVPEPLTAIITSN